MDCSLTGGLKKYPPPRGAVSLVYTMGVWRRGSSGKRILMRVKGIGTAMIGKIKLQG